MGDTRRYWAFLSYGHDDRRMARRLHREIETYAVPRRLLGRATLMGPAPRRLTPIFRDRDDLTVDASLAERLNEALRASAYLIVLCSPAAARSKWVNEEIKSFKSLYGSSRVIPVLLPDAGAGRGAVGHDPEEHFPAALRAEFDASGAIVGESADPIAADLRPGQDGWRLTRLKIVARMLEVGLDELIRRDAQRRQTQLIAIAGASTVGTLAMAGLAAFAVVQSHEARDQRAKAEDLVEFMLTDLRKKLEPEGRVDVLGAVGEKAMAYYASEQGHGMDADALGRRARVLHLLGELDAKRGNLALAAKSFEQAEPATAELLRREPNNPNRLFEHAQSVFWIGFIALQRGENATAEAKFAEYKRLASQLSALDPKNDKWLMEVGYADSDLGTVLAREGRDQEAADATEKAFQVLKTLAERAPGDRDRQFALAQEYADVADAQVNLGHIDVALANREAERAIYRRLLAKSDFDNDTAESLYSSLGKTASLLADQGRVEAALQNLNAAEAGISKLAAAYPKNTEYHEDRVAVLETMARCLLMKNDAVAALSVASKARRDAEALVAADPNVEVWSGRLLGGARALEMQARRSLARTPEERRAALSPAPREAARLDRLCDHRAPDTRTLLVDGQMSLLAGDFEREAGSIEEARRHWAHAVKVLTQAGFNKPERRGQSASNLLEAALSRLATDQQNPP
jgi:tetratricopeptide (TPR) repeat protein